MVTILMSTYNGSKYLEQQIQSIMNQDIGINNINILIRDDNSKDDTNTILKRFENQNNNINVINGENLGPAYSFWELIRKVDLESDYYAFSDQDDIWLPDKISSAIKVVQSYEEPVLYYCNALYVDKSGQSLERYALNKENHLSVPTLMAGVTALGCTMIFNKSAMKIFKAAQLTGIEMHDRTCYIIMYLIGKIVYDKTYHIHYRQHDNNVIGNSENKSLKRIMKRFKQSYALWFKSQEHSAVIQANDMLNNYSSMLRREDREYLELISTYKHNLRKKFKLIFDHNIKHIEKGTRRSYRLRILLNLF
ncbi:glycosyltransferase [Clostridium folliculivorans]|uniref:glycosyltransferase n=1 Tax=Clostridium folliculivorans TaxID=2886038 RepID=UPI0021C3E1F9|nr:glycosyltransferase [Clostridium folliculivorans]GKU31641.1 alpha-L-Rha alpha-1,3-L-rhamnosyltransferase [Clostridium folliculivorans]